VLTEKINPAIFGFLFSALHLVGTIAFIVWAIDYDGLNTRVQFTSDPIGFISLGIVSGALFSGFCVVLTAGLLLLVIRYHWRKNIEMVNILTKGQLPKAMTAAHTESNEEPV